MESLEIVGLAKLQSAMARYGTKAVPALASALYAEAQDMFALSQQLVPVDKGYLRASGHVKPIAINGSTIEVTIAYGGLAAPYALIVHERIFAPSGKKVYHRRPTQAKYLETAVKRKLKGFDGRLARRTMGKLLG